MGGGNFYVGRVCTRGIIWVSGVKFKLKWINSTRCVYGNLRVFPCILYVRAGECGICHADEIATCSG